MHIREKYEIKLDSEKPGPGIWVQKASGPDKRAWNPERISTYPLVLKVFVRQSKAQPWLKMLLESQLSNSKWNEPQQSEDSLA